jgi:hypothetical protein
MRAIFRLRSVLVISALTLLPIAGCFDTANTNELSCTQSKYCPDGYACVGAQPGLPGKCQRAVDAGGFDVIVVVDGPSRLDGQGSGAPDAAYDGPTTNTDTMAAIDQSPALDMSNEPVAALDLSADLGRDVPPDSPLSPLDTSADNTAAVLDLGPDQKMQGPDAAPDLPHGPEVGPDVPPTGCVIGGTSYPNGTANPANICQVCKVGTAPSGWSNADQGTSCGSGQYCNVGTCKAGCFISGAYYANGAANPANACQTCQTTEALTAWTAGSNGTSCGAGQVCSGGTCQSGCWIAGGLVGSGSTNASNACQICKPATSTSAWSSNTDGTSCGGGRTCSSGTCSCPAPTTDCGTSGCINVSGNDSSHCGSCTNVCATNQICSSGSCQCTLGAPACGGCLAWNFEWGSDPTPWALELASNLTGANGATNIAITQSKYHGGNSALIAPVLIDMSTTYDAEVAVSTSCANNIAGYSMSAWVFLSGPELTAWNNNLMVDTWGPSGLGDNSVLYWGNIPTGAWFQITTSFVSAVPINRIGIRLTPNTNWVGTIYVDDVVITGL